MMIFLSHKSIDKTLVREFHRTLSVLGLDPWLDEEAMAAGSNLQRVLPEAMKNSCAVVFFLTESFVDERYLADEIDYATSQKRDRAERFAIISLVMPSQPGKTVTVPDPLRRFVYKNPSGELEALREILRALPAAAGGLMKVLDLKKPELREGPTAAPAALSEKAEQLLCAAGDPADPEADGEIWRLSMEGGYTVRVGTHQFSSPASSRREDAEWQQALE